ncbi:MAG TPA: hypothetical protein VFV50_17850 [Bdellovibrionales bacterium]|nr:hypothetical protein [Bdellovibrionales bacterium]
MGYSKIIGIWILVAGIIFYFDLLRVHRPVRHQLDPAAPQVEYDPDEFLSATPRPPDPYAFALGYTRHRYIEEDVGKIIEVKRDPDFKAAPGVHEFRFFIVGSRDLHEFNRGVLWTKVSVTGIPQVTDAVWEYKGKRRVLLVSP